MISETTYFMQWSFPSIYVCVTGTVDFSTKKEVFDRVMAVRRLQEEKKILVKEIKQHWDSLKAHASVLSELSLLQSENTLQGKCAHLFEIFVSGFTKSCLIFFNLLLTCIVTHFVPF